MSLDKYQIEYLIKLIERAEMQRASLIDNLYDIFSAEEIKILCKAYDDVILRLEFKLTKDIPVNELEIIKP